jgi:hypothetical protein
VTIAALYSLQHQATRYIAFAQEHTRVVSNPRTVFDIVSPIHVLGSQLAANDDHAAALQDLPRRLQ